MHAALGLLVFPALAWILSENRRRFPLKLAVACLALQAALGVLLYATPVISDFFLLLNRAVDVLNDSARAGSSYMFGYLGGAELPFAETKPGASFIVAFQVLPIVLVTSALASLLYHFRVLPLLIQGFAWLLRKTLGGDALNLFMTSASVFFGVIETPVIFKSYLSRMSRSQMFCLLTVSMANVAGTVMALYASVLSPVLPNAVGEIIIASLLSAPAAILIARIMVPEESGLVESESFELPRQHDSAFSALVEGTQEGIQMMIGIAGFIIVFFSLVALTNRFIDLLTIGSGWTLQDLVALPYRPLVWLTGLSWDESAAGSRLMATKTVLNEFVAYMDMAKIPTESLSAHGRLLMTYAMCGFANLGSLGIVVSGLGVLIPDRRKEVAVLALKAVLAGNLVTLLNAAMIGLVRAPFVG